MNTDTPAGKLILFGLIVAAVGGFLMASGGPAANGAQAAFRVGVVALGVAMLLAGGLWAALGGSGGGKGG